MRGGGFPGCGPPEQTHFGIGWVTLWPPPPPPPSVTHLFSHFLMFWLHSIFPMFWLHSIFLMFWLYSIFPIFWLFSNFQMFWLYSNFLMFWLYLYRYHKYRLWIENWYKTNDISKSCCSRLPQPRNTPPPPPISVGCRSRAGPLPCRYERLRLLRCCPAPPFSLRPASVKPPGARFGARSSWLKGPAILGNSLHRRRHRLFSRGGGAGGLL
jgi:hypothetical protein